MRSAVLLLGLASSSAWAAPQGDWWSADYEYRQKITVDASGLGLSGDVSNFPVLVRFSDFDDEVTFETRVDFTKMRADGNDVVFVDDAGDILDFEVEIFSKSNTYGAFHVKLDTVRASGTNHFWVYYGNPDASSSLQNASAVWDSDFEAVWHVGDPDPSDPSTNRSHDLTDSTGRGRQKDAKGNTVTSAFSYGYYASLDGDGDFWGDTSGWDINSVLGYANEVTVSYWFASSMNGSSQYWNAPGILGVQSNNSTNDVFYGYVRGSSGSRVFGFHVPGSTAIETGAVDGGWHHALLVREHDYWWNNSDDEWNGYGRIKMYIDGQLVEERTDSSWWDKTTSVWYVGRIPNGSLDYFSGLLDEVRVSSTSRSADWAKLEWAAYLDNSEGTFILDFCDGVTYYPDVDGDGYGAETGGVQCIEGYAWLTDNSDCNDNSADANDFAEEVCDGIDNDCDNLVDDDDPDVQSSFYVDGDGDGLGAGSAVQLGACSDTPDGYSAFDTDCNDSDENILGPTPWWPDTDGDGTGVLDGAVAACTTPADHVAPSAIEDCEPTNPNIHPGAQEVCDVDDVDEDCDQLSDNSDPSATGQTDWWQDNDGDTWGAGPSTLSCDLPVAGFVQRDGDCNDNDILIHPETNWYRDDDGDGYGNGTATVQCDIPAETGWSLSDQDCDDSDATLSPETPWYEDNDLDTFGDIATEVQSCTNPDPDTNNAPEFVRNSQDCDDSCFPSCSATFNDEPDGDPWYQDADSDNFGDPSVERKACTQPTGFVADNTDCDDTNEFVYPGQTDADTTTPRSCDGFDDNCIDSLTDDGPSADLDGDGVIWIDEFNMGADGCSVDSDGDGVLDIEEYGRTDSDNDGVPDVIDGDDDGDNVPTANEDINGNGDPTDDDTDNDQIPNYLDDDDDGDGIPTRSEDIDGDGDPNNDESELSEEGSGVADGIPDYLDVDDDGDGINTALELPYGSQYTMDADGDTYPDSLEWSESGDLTQEPPWDLDTDNTPNIIDPDDDGDNIATVLEGGLGECQSYPDDGIPAYLDTDTDGDGALDIDEGDQDADGNGQPDFYDCEEENGVNFDRDNDGLVNGDERCDTTDTACIDLRGCLDEFNPDTDGDGIPDGAEVGGNINAPRDFDNDGIIDACDDDDDNDTALTVDELSIMDPLGNCVGGSGCPAVPGLPAAPTLPDMDGDGSPNHIDRDDDDDGALTPDEDADADGNPHNDDGDWDQIPDYLDADEENGPCGDADGDGLPTWAELNVTDTDPANADSDGDGVPDGIEYGQAHPWPIVPTPVVAVGCDDITLTDSWLAPVDTDQDTIPDVEDDDDDGDGVPTADEGGFDVDGDGLPNYLDPDADGDGILDQDEATGDEDEDGIPDYLDAVFDQVSGVVDSWGGDTAGPIEDCGCHSSGSAGWLALFVPFLVRRRR